VANYDVRLTPIGVALGNERGLLSIINLGPGVLYLDSNTSVSKLSGVRVPVQCSVLWNPATPLFAVSESKATLQVSGASQVLNPPSGNNITRLSDMRGVAEVVPGNYAQVSVISSADGLNTESYQSIRIDGETSTASTIPEVMVTLVVAWFDVFIPGQPNTPTLRETVRIGNKLGLGGGTGDASNTPFTAILAVKGPYVTVEATNTYNGVSTAFPPVTLRWNYLRVSGMTYPAPQLVKRNSFTDAWVSTALLVNQLAANSAQVELWTGTPIYFNCLGPKVTITVQAVLGFLAAGIEIAISLASSVNGIIGPVYVTTGTERSFVFKDIAIPFSSDLALRQYVGAAFPGAYVTIVWHN